MFENIDQATVRECLQEPPKVSSHFADGCRALSAKLSVWVMLSSLVHEYVKHFAVFGTK